MGVRWAAGALPLLAWAVACKADEAPAPPPLQGVWFGKGQFGFLSSHGNSDSESINGNIDVLRYDGAWKNEIYLAGLYGRNTGIVSAERFGTRIQSNYNINEFLFAFAGFRYEHDEFDGFQYQYSGTGGLGYKLVNTNDTKLTMQLGAGYRRLRPETIDKDANGAVILRTPEKAQGEAIGTVSIDFSHAFSKTTLLTNKLLAESGAGDTLVHDEIALTVKMTDRLALSVGYGVTDNTKPPPPLKRFDTIETVNLQFSF